ncbi:MAG: asparagine synthase B [Lawsonibacter sp.]|jgi:asparagine synthase (glutamine-hydrolysing)|nr:asparagine synthase B [Lawsonibacter sp.]MCI9268539.1 asparagine synthase B [Lawsonibacter sp.]
MCSIIGYCGPMADLDAVQRGFDRTKSRGPDDSRVIQAGQGMLGFHRLSIMGLTPAGMQPFELDGSFAVCNGEIYGFEPLKEKLAEKGYVFHSASDCEILLPMYQEYGTDMFALLDAEFACILYDSAADEFIAARDPIGIRPLYYGYDRQGTVIFASEPKNLLGLTDKIMPFPPGHYYRGGKFVCYHDIAKVEHFCYDELEICCRNIREKLVAGVEKRLVADAKVGFLLSGGLDSSLVCAIAAKRSNTPIKTFAIGMDTDAIDLKYARQAADFIGSDHREIIITRENVLSSLETVIELLGTYDITTIRASMGMYLICKAIHEQTDIRVLLTGEISDELFGYKYTDYAPSAQAFQEEAEKRVRELHMYDVLRADRCISVNSLEARVPFGDLDFVRYVMAIDPEKKLNTYGKGKYLLRKAFEGGWLPDSILWREKAAFSDAVGHSLVDDLKEYAEARYTSEELEAKRQKYRHAQPFTKESLLYREIFERYYPGQSGMVADFWMPNKAWEGCDVNDPSARVLANYGGSGV